MLRLLLIAFFSFTQLLALSQYEVAQKNDTALSGFEDASSNMQMILINANAQKRIRHMRSKTLELPNGDKSLMEFLSPADVKGTKFLNYEHVKKDDDQWLYLPAIKRTKRISSKNKSGAFMGSEFSYEDVSSFNILKYDYKDAQASEELYNNKEVYVIERYPNYKYSAYTKQVAYIDKTNFLTLKVDYYDRKKSLYKSAMFSDYKRIQGVWRIGKIHMKNFQNSKESILTWENETLKTGLSHRHFHKRVLKK